MTDLAAYGFSVDSTSVVKAAKDLDQMSAASVAAARAGQQFGDATSALKQRLDQLSQAQQQQIQVLQAVVAMQTQMAQMMTAARDQTLAFSTAMTAMQGVSVDATKVISAMNGQLGKTAESSVKAAAGVTQLRGAITGMGSETQKAGSELNTYAKIVDNVGLSSAELGGAVERINQAMTKLNPAAQQVRQEIERLGVSLKGAKPGDEIRLVAELIGKYQEYADTRSKNESIFITTGLKSEEAIKKIGTAYIDVSESIKKMSKEAIEASKREEELQRRIAARVAVSPAPAGPAAQPAQAGGFIGSLFGPAFAAELSLAVRDALSQGWLTALPKVISTMRAFNETGRSSYDPAPEYGKKLISPEDAATARALVDATDSLVRSTRLANAELERANDLFAKGALSRKQFAEVLYDISIRYNDVIGASQAYTAKIMEEAGAVERLAEAEAKAKRTREAADAAQAYAAAAGGSHGLRGAVPFAENEYRRRGRLASEAEGRAGDANAMLNQTQEWVDALREQADATFRVVDAQKQLNRVMMDADAPTKNMKAWAEQYAADLARVVGELRKRIDAGETTVDEATGVLHSFVYRNNESYRQETQSFQQSEVRGEFSSARRAELEAYFSAYNAAISRWKGDNQAWVEGMNAANEVSKRFADETKRAFDAAKQGLEVEREIQGMDPTQRAIQRARKNAVNTALRRDDRDMTGAINAGDVAAGMVETGLQGSANQRMTAALMEADALEKTAAAYLKSAAAGQAMEAQGRANIEKFQNSYVNAELLTEALIRVQKAQYALSLTRESKRAEEDLRVATEMVASLGKEGDAVTELRTKIQALSNQRLAGSTDAQREIDQTKLRRAALAELTSSTTTDITQRQAQLDVQRQVNDQMMSSTKTTAELRKEIETSIKVRHLVASAASAQARGDHEAAQAARTLADALKALSAGEADEARRNAINEMTKSMQEQLLIAEKELTLVGQRAEVQQVELTVYREMLRLKKDGFNLDSAAVTNYIAMIRQVESVRQKTDEARRANEEWSRVAQRVTDRLVDGFTAGKFALKDFGAFALETFKEIAKNSIIRPIISPIIYGAFGATDPTGASGGIFSGIGKSISEAIFGAAAKDSMKDLFSPVLSGLKSIFSPDNFIANMFPSIFGPGVATTATMSAATTGAMMAGEMSALSGTVGAMGATAGPLAAMAPFLPILAIALPLLLSGIFNKKESVGPNANAVINLEGGALTVGGIGADNGGDAGIARQMAEAVTKGMKEIMKSIGGSISGFGGAGDIEKTQVGYFKGKYFSMVDGKRQEFGQAEAAVTDFIVRALKHADISGISTTMRQALTRTTADTIEELGKVIDFTKLYERNFVAANAYENQMKAMAETFDEWRDMTRELGLDMGKTEGAISKMRTAAINAFHDVGTVAEELMKKVAEGVVGFGSSMDKTAASLDYAINQTKAAATSYRSMGTALRGTASGLRISDLSTLSPADKLVEAQSQYGAAMTKARGGDQEAAQQAQQLAQRVLELARGMFASGSGYTAIYDQIQGDLMGAANAQDAIAIRLDVQTVLLTAQRDILLEIRELMDEATKRMGDVSSLSNLGFAQDLTDPARIKYDELLTRLSTFLGNTPGAAANIATIRTAIGNNQVTAAEATSITGARDSLEAKVQGKLASEVGAGSDLYVSWNALSAALEYNRTTADSLGTVIRNLGETFRNIAVIFGGVASSPIQNMGALSALMTNLGTFVGGIAGVNPPASIATFLTSLQTFATSIVGIADLNLTQFTAISIAIQAVGTGLNVLSGVSVSSTDIGAIFSTTATWFGGLGAMQNDPAIRAAIGPTGVLSSLNGAITALSSTTTSSVPGVVSATTGLPAVSLSLSNFSSALAAAALPPAISALTGALGAADSGLQSSLTGAKTAAGDFKKAIDDLVEALTDNIRNIDGMIGARAVQIDRSAIAGDTTAAFNTLAQRASTYVGSVAQVLGGAPDQTQLSQLSGWQWAISKRQEIIGAATSENDLTSILDRFYGGTRERTASTVDQGINEILDRIARIHAGGTGPTGPTNMESSYRAWLQANPRQTGEGESEVMQPDQYDAYMALDSLNRQGIAPSWFGAFRSWWNAGHKVDDLSKFAMGDLITGRSMFNFSSRARMTGEAGEAGEEFIMPAARTSSGAMGVRAVMPEDDEGNEILGRISSKLSSIHDVLVDQVEQADDHHSTLTRQNAMFAGSRSSVSGTRSP